MSVEADIDGEEIKLLLRSSNEKFKCEKYASFGNCERYEVSVKLTKQEAKDVIRQLLYCL